MDDIDKILYTAVSTVVGGLIFHFISQLFLKTFIEPLQNYREHKSKAISLINYYSNILEMRLERCETEEEKARFFKASDEIRMCYSNLTGAYDSISFKWIAIFFHLIPKKDKFKKGSRKLLDLSFLGNWKSKNYDGLKYAEDTFKLLNSDF